MRMCYCKPDNSLITVYCDLGTKKKKKKMGEKICTTEDRTNMNNKCETQQQKQEKYETYTS